MYIPHVWLSILQIISILLSFSQKAIANFRENASVRFWVWIQP